MLDEITPEEFDLWHAAYLTGRIDDSWAQAAMGCAVLVNVIKEVAAGFAGSKLPESSIVSPSQFMPPFEVEQKPDDSIDRFSEALAAKFQGVTQ